MAMAKLQLAVDSYDRLVEEHAKTLATGNPIPRDLRVYETFSRGDEIVPRDQAEFDRLTAGPRPIALDPKEANRRERERLDNELKRIEAERKRLESEEKDLGSEAKSASAKA